MNNVGKIFKEHTMQIVLVLVVIIFSITTKGTILSANNFEALITQNAYVFILATGMFMCMLIKGNIDLSVGSVVCIVDAIGASLMAIAGVPVPIAMLVMLVIGCLIGSLLGWLIAYLNIPPWIATLGGFLAFRGAGTQIVTSVSTSASVPVNDVKGFVNLFNSHIPNIGAGDFNITSIIIGVVCCLILFITQFRSRATKLKKGYAADSFVAVLVRCVILSAVIMLFAFKYAQAKAIPMVLVWVVVILLVYDFITSKTTLGRYFYAMGGNMEATRLSGIDTKKILFLAYFNMQFLTVIAGWTALAKITANPTIGTNYEMDAISACIVGGVSAYGGSGSVFGMVVGATLIGVINLGMSIMSIDPNWQKVIKGLVLLAAVVFEIVNNKDKNKE